MHRLEAEYWGKIDFVYIDSDASSNKSVKDRFNARGYPIFVLIEPDGTEIGRWFGYVDTNDLQLTMDSYLANAS